MKRGFTLELVNGEYIIAQNGHIYKKLGKISQEQAWIAFETFKQYMDVK